MYPQFKSDNVSYEFINKMILSTVQMLQLNSNNKVIKVLDAHSLERWWHLVTRVLILQQSPSRCTCCSAPMSYHDKCEYCGEMIWGEMYE